MLQNSRAFPSETGFYLSSSPLSHLTGFQAPKKKMITSSDLPNTLKKRKSQINSFTINRSFQEKMSNYVDSDC
jgi:hypothetical protein